MAEEKKEFTINAQPRAGRGKNDARRLRAAGLVPLSLYGNGTEPVAVTVSQAEIAAVLRSPEGRNTVFTLAIEGGETAQVRFQDRQVHPLTGRLMHADLMRA